MDASDNIETIAIQEQYPRVEALLTDFLTRHNIPLLTFLKRGVSNEIDTVPETIEAATRAELTMINEGKEGHWKEVGEVTMNMTLLALSHLINGDAFESMVRRNNKILERLHNNGLAAQHAARDAGNQNRFELIHNGMRLTAGIYMLLRNQFEAQIRSYQVNAARKRGQDVDEEDFVGPIFDRDGKIVGYLSHVYGALVAAPDNMTKELAKAETKKYGPACAKVNLDHIKDESVMFILGDSSETALRERIGVESETIGSDSPLPSIPSDFLERHSISPDEVVKIRALLNLIARYNQVTIKEEGTNSTNLVNIEIPYIETVMYAEQVLTLSFYREIELTISSPQEYKQAETLGIIDRLLEDESLRNKINIRFADGVNPPAQVKEKLSQIMRRRAYVPSQEANIAA